MKNEKANKILFYKIRFVFLIFIFANLALYIGTAFRQMIGRPYPATKVYMSSAVMTNVLYVFPLSKISGIHGILVTPFYPLRDFFYAKGVSNLPEGDLEREMWWVAVRFDEFHNLYEKPLLSYVAHKVNFYSVNPDEYYKWTDEFYEHLKKLASEKKMADAYLKSKKLVKFIDVADRYSDIRDALYYRREEDAAKVDFPYNYSFFKNKPEINKLSNLLAWYFKVKTDDQGVQKRDVLNGQAPLTYQEMHFLFDVSKSILSSKILLKESFCDSDEREIFNMSQDKLRDLLQNPESGLSKKQQYVLSNLLDKTLVYFVNDKLEYCEVK
jgi:hypothetical protein